MLHAAVGRQFASAGKRAVQLQTLLESSLAECEMLTATLKTFSSASGPEAAARSAHTARQSTAHLAHNVRLIESKLPGGRPSAMKNQ